MPRSIAGALKEISGLPKAGRKNVVVDGKKVSIPVPFPSPIDWRDTFIYFLMVDRFSNPTDNRVPPPFESPTGERLGGTLRGVTAKLDYIKSLGAGALWLSPVLKNTHDSIHGYSIQDFFTVDSRFGTEADLIELVDQAHGRGMYVILDIVINHAGDVFAYQTPSQQPPYQAWPYPIQWRMADATPNPAWRNAPPDIPPNDPQLLPDATIWPDELRNNEFFRRCGIMGTDERKGDFATLKEFITEASVQANNRTYYPVRDALIKIHQYLIAKFDIDGFRIDTIKHVEREFSLVFGNAVRECAMKIGKKNFFTFGEAKAGDDSTLAAYTGRYATDPSDMVGLDSTLDFPLMYTLGKVVKAIGDNPPAPASLAALYENRKALLSGQIPGSGVVVSSHGEASRFYVVFIDNHDEKSRFRYCPPPNDINAAFFYDRQVTLALGCLFCLQGIPCLYYGTEQGLRGSGDQDWCVREALWGKPGGGFDESSVFFREVKAIAGIRASQPALRYGRQYFRPVSGDGRGFGLSKFPGGVISFSRILNSSEIVVIANTNTQQQFAGFIVVDFDVHAPGEKMKLLYSNRGPAAAGPGPIIEKAGGSVVVEEVNGAVTSGPLRVLPVTLGPMEIQILL
jgi:glycosidase